MLITHETKLLLEAEWMGKILTTVYGLDCRTKVSNSTKFFGSHPTETDGVLLKECESIRKQYDITKNELLFHLTSKDIFCDKEADDWIYGQCSDEIIIASTARLCVQTSRKRYRQRMEFIALHEVGHALINGDHFVDTYWISYTGKKMELGLHCTNSRCIMYQVADLTTPTDGYLLFGKQKRYDGGLDELIDRKYQKQLCKECLTAPRYKKI